VKRGTDLAEQLMTMLTPSPSGPGFYLN